jgi:predicted Zn-dependent protease
LTLVALKGKYDGPFARILLAVIALREKHPEEAERLLAGLAKDYPDNPLIRKELARVTRQLHPGGAVTK